MADTNDEKNNNTGCIVGIVLLVIGGLVYFFCTTSGEEIAEFGMLIMAGAGLAAAYFILKYLGIIKKNDSSSATTYEGKKDDAESNKFPVKGCLILVGIIAFFAAMVAIFTSSMELNYVIGIAAIVIVAVVIGLFMYNNR